MMRVRRKRPVARRGRMMVWNASSSTATMHIMPRIRVAMRNTASVRQNRGNVVRALPPIRRIAEDGRAPFACILATNGGGLRRNGGVGQGAARSGRDPDRGRRSAAACRAPGDAARPPARRLCLARQKRAGLFSAGDIDPDQHCAHAGVVSALADAPVAVGSDGRPGRGGARDNLLSLGLCFWGGLVERPEIPCSAPVFIRRRTQWLPPLRKNAAMQHVAVSPPPTRNTAAPTARESHRRYKFSAPAVTRG